MRAIILLLLANVAFANPTNLQAVDINPVGATLTWDADPYAESYSVWESTSITYWPGFRPIAEVVGTSYVIDTLQLGTTKSYRVVSNYDSFPAPEVTFTTIQGDIPDQVYQFTSDDFPYAEQAINLIEGKYKVQVRVIDPSKPKGERLVSKETVKFGY